MTQHKVDVLDPRWRPGFEDLKTSTLKWLRERFEVTAAEFPPGKPEDPGDCPIARLLGKAGFDSVRVYTPEGKRNIRIHYWVGADQKVVVMPRYFSLFPRWFDEGAYPELIDPQSQSQKEKEDSNDPNKHSPSSPAVPFNILEEVRG